MTREEFVTRVARRMALEEPGEAEKATHQVLATLGESLRWADAEKLAEDLPPELGHALGGPNHASDLDADGMYRRVAERMGVRPGVALEYSVAVLRTVAEAIGDDRARLVRDALPPSIAPLLLAPDPIPAPPVVHRAPDRSTIAEGHGGGSRPLYAARPDFAHSHSVARNENPHADTKLSSARGISQEREGNTLAEGRPGSSRPLTGRD